MTRSYEWAEIGARLKEAREYGRFAPEQVAEALQFGPGVVSAIEDGSRNVYANELLRLALLYRRPVAWFLGDEPDPVRAARLMTCGGQLAEQNQRSIKMFALFLARGAAGSPVRSR